jgi:hypothetical protein
MPIRYWVKPTRPGRSKASKLDTRSQRASGVPDRVRRQRTDGRSAAWPAWSVMSLMSCSPRVAPPTAMSARCHRHHDRASGSRARPARKSGRSLSIRATPSNPVGSLRTVGSGCLWPWPCDRYRSMSATRWSASTKDRHAATRDWLPRSALGSSLRADGRRAPGPAVAGSWAPPGHCLTRQYVPSLF